LLAQQLEIIQLEANEARARERNLQELREKLLFQMSGSTSKAEEQANCGTIRELRTQLEDLQLQLSIKELDMEALRNAKDSEITKLDDQIIKLEASNRVLKYELDRVHKLNEESQAAAEERFRGELQRTVENYEDMLEKLQKDAGYRNSALKAELAATEERASESDILRRQLDCMQGKVDRLLAERKLMVQDSLEGSLCTMGSSFSDLTTTFRRRPSKSQQETEELVSQLTKRYGDAIEARDALIYQLKLSNAGLQKKVLSVQSDLASTSFQLSQLQSYMGDMSQSERERMLTDEVKSLIGKLIKAKNKQRATGAMMRRRVLKDSNLSDSRLQEQAESFAKSFDKSFSSFNIM